MAQLRTGNHRFACERGRWENIELHKRKCSLCNLQEIGEEFHYILVCPFSGEERKTFLEGYYFLNPKCNKV